MNALRDRVAIVTGASRGIGKALALRLAKEGVAVVAAAKTMEGNEKLPGCIPETVRAIEQGGGRAVGVRCDVRKEEDLENLVQKAVESFGRIDILINNAGAMWIESLLNTPPKRFDLVMDINFRAPFLLARMCVPYMQKGNWGHIVNMSPPIEAPHLHQVRGKIAYMVSKLGATLLTVGLAQELKEMGIACNSLWPRTLVESLATINLGIGQPEEWRKNDIVVDATLAILEQDPRELTGKTLVDDEALRTLWGQTDFTRYRVVPGKEPNPMDWDRWDKVAEEARLRFFAAMALGSGGGQGPAR
jgi:NAD(P)-dependent dehydrogenase (short-subunit alcohol dehydrogenase family)